ncbi:MAG: ribosome recycling factor [Myxococcales bacterium]|nr:ribosome recycling factor [Myxococcales bacterium]
MINDVINELKTKCKNSIEAFSKDLSRIRTGRATPTLLDGIRVNYYGAPTPLNQVANVAVADARLLTVSPWEKSLLGDIEKAIQASDLGLTPNNDGKIIRVPIPTLTGERRKDLAKQVKKLNEEYKVTIRGHRRDSNDELKLYKDEKTLSEDEYHKGLKRVQDETDAYIKKVDEVASEKEQEIMDF